MLTKDILPLVKLRLDSLNISNDKEVLIPILNLGITELYKRFNLSIKSETINCNRDLALYELRSDDVLMLLTVYDKFGKELKQTDVYGNDHFDIKLVNYRSFILNKPFNGYVFAIYKAAHTQIMDENDEIDLPAAMLPALLDYAAYVGHSSLNSNSQNTREFGIHMQIFEQSCQQLEAQGYRLPLNTESVAIQAKGFV